jgi:hypothetical protein
MRVSWLYPLLAAAVIAQGCTESEAEIANGDDPLRALASGQISDRYTSSYWAQKMAEEPGLWAQAVAYCDQNEGAEYPNCTAVRYARALEVNSRPPEYEANTSLRPGARSQPPDDPQ